MRRPALPPCVVLFDGRGNFCNGFVQWLIARDPRHLCYFVPSQSTVGNEVMQRYGISPEAAEGTIHVLAEGRLLVRSGAAVAVLDRLTFPWRMIALCRWLPVGVRDAAYRYFARNRYRWFGRSESCRIPSEGEQSRFPKGIAEVEEIARASQKGSPESGRGRNL